MNTKAAERDAIERFEPIMVPGFDLSRCEYTKEPEMAPHHSGRYVRYEDYATLQAKLEAARTALKQIDRAVNYELNLGNYDHDDVCPLDADWIEVGNIAETALSSLEQEDG